jgi:hypothetical protein
MMMMAYVDSPFNQVALLYGWLTRAVERGSKLKGKIFKASLQVMLLVVNE